MRVFPFYALLFVLPVLFALPASAQSFIRDAEIEQTLRNYAAPILQSAQLEPENVRLFIINDPSINAFVAGGSNIFLHTGLLLAADDPTMILGVIAHEAGHIAGGHLAQGAEQLENAQLSTILSYVLGAAAGVAGGGNAGAAIVTAGQQLAERKFLSFTRMNEEAADTAALSYLDTTQVSAAGLLNLLEKLRLKETVYRGRIDPYALTHPLSKERISHIRGHLLHSTIAEDTVPEGYQQSFERMIAKLQGFLQPPDITLSQYPAEDYSLKARYARAVAYHRLSKLDASLKEMEALLETAPEDPFFLELRGQILAESGKPSEALPYYRKAAEKLPDSALLHQELGATLLTQKPPAYTEALAELKRSSLLDNSNATTWELLGQCHTALNEKGQAALAYAEAALLQNKSLEAIRYASTALKTLPRHSPSRLRAEDIEEEATRVNKKLTNDRP
jgi:predicted Zn-dependent protease